MHLQVAPVATIQEEFVRLLPAFEKTIDWILLACPRAERVEARQDATALCWKRYRRLAEVGKNPATYPTIIALWAAKHVLAGRRLFGAVSSKDALSPVARARRSFSVQSLDSSLRAALATDARMDVADQVAFRIDFPNWLARMPNRDRRLAADLAAGRSASEVARKFGVCAARVSQKRREFARSWDEFHGEQCKQRNGSAA